MKTKNALKVIAAALIGASAWGCDAMWDSSVDIPLGYGGSVGVNLSTPVYGSPWYNGWNSWNSWNNWNNYPWGWNSGPIFRPIVRPIIPSGPPAQKPGGNWRPPVNNNNRPPLRPGNGSGNGNINFVPGTLPKPPASANTPNTPVKPVTRPGRH